MIPLQPIITLRRWVCKLHIRHLKSLEKRVGRLIADRNLLVHGTVVFDGGGDNRSGPGVRWLVRRGGYNRMPQPVTLEMVNRLIEECKALTDDISTIGRFNVHVEER